MSQTNLIEPEATPGTGRGPEPPTQTHADILQAIRVLVTRHDRIALLNDLVEYASSGHMTKNLERELDRDEVCRHLMDLIFRAQLATIREMAVMQQITPTGT